MSNGIVDGTNGNDFIESTYVDVHGETVNNTREVGGNEEPSVVRAGDGNDTISNTAIWNVGGYGLIYGEAGDDTFQIDLNDGHARFWGGEGSDEIALAGRNETFSGFRPITASIDDFNVNEDAISIAGLIIGPHDLANGFERFSGIVEISGTDERTTIVFRADLDEEYPGSEYQYEERVYLKDVSLDEFLAAYEVSSVVDGTSADDFINLTYADAQGDTVSNDGNADIVFAGEGNDTVALYRGNDTAYGGEGDDRLYGMKGNNVLHGDAGNDFIHSGRHTSELFGGDGEDVLVAQLNKGADHELTGGADADTYQLQGAVEGKTSNVVIHDFVIGEDVLEIDGVVVDVTDLPDGMSLDQDDDGNAVLSFADDETVTLMGGIEGLDLGDGLILPFVPLDESMDIENLEDEDFPEDLLV